MLLKGLSETQDILAEAKFRLLDAMNEDRGFAFLAIGRPEAAGCYCAINTYLRQVISMLADEFDYVVIDGEAGIEQINRRVMEKVTHLLLVSDQSRKGIEIIKTIAIHFLSYIFMTNSSPNDYSLYSFHCHTPYPIIKIKIVFNSSVV